MKVELISQGVHRYNGVWLSHGKPFVADNETDADDLCTIGFAKRAPAAYATRDLVAEQPAAVVAEPRQKRAYHRRDLTAAQ